MVPGLCCFNTRPFNSNSSLKRPTDKHKQVTADQSLRLSCCHLYGCLFVDSVALPHATTRGTVEHPITLPLPCSHWLTETVSIPSGCAHSSASIAAMLTCCLQKAIRKFFFHHLGTDLTLRKSDVTADLRQVQMILNFL